MILKVKLFVHQWMMNDDFRFPTLFRAEEKAAKAAAAKLAYEKRIAEEEEQKRKEEEEKKREEEAKKNEKANAKKQKEREKKQTKRERQKLLDYCKVST